MKKRAALQGLWLWLFGVLASLPLHIPDTHLLSFVLFCPLLYRLLRLCRQKARFKQFYRTALLFDLGYFMGAFCFFLSMYPLDFAGLGAVASVLVLLLATVALPLFQAALHALFTLPLWLLARAELLFPLVFTAAAATLYTLFSHLQCFTWLGVPWAHPALALTDAPALAGVVAWIGTGGLILLILAINAALCEMVDALREDADRRALTAFLLALFLFVGNLGTGAILISRTPSETARMRVAVIQPDVSSIREMSNPYTPITVSLRLARQAAEEEVDLMLWSESVVQFSIESDPSLFAAFSELAVETGAIQVVGSFTSPTKEEYYNALLMFYPDGSISETAYYKRRPVPFGEYLPWPAFFAVVCPPLTELNLLSRNTMRGEGAQLFTTDAGVLGGLICFDSLYPALARESVGEGAELILLSTNDSWFDGSTAKRIHLAHAKLRAMENGRTVVRAGNTGLSAIIQPNGSTNVGLPKDTPGYFTAEVALTDTTTLYTRIGDLPLYLFSVGVLGLSTVALCKILKKRRTSHERKS